MTSPVAPAPNKPDKLRTCWHPLVPGFRHWQLRNHCYVQEEVPVGKKPLPIDFLFLHKTQGGLSGLARKVLAGLVDHLDEHTLIARATRDECLFGWVGDWWIISTNIPSSSGRALPTPCGPVISGRYSSMHCSIVARITKTSIRPA